MIYFKNSHVRLIGYSLLLISILIFLLTWLRWYVGIPASLLLIFAFVKLAQNVLTDKSEIAISRNVLLLICFFVLAWVLISGVGGAFPQKADLHWRNAIFHDMINYNWPVRYTDGFDSSLTYYIAFWMIPSIFGKFFSLVIGAQSGWIAANIISAIYCSSLIIVMVLLLLNHLNINTKANSLLVLFILVIFSGMDIIPVLVLQTFSNGFDDLTHLEWWTYIEYSSNTTQLSWVFNQAVPTWLVVSLLLNEKDKSNFAFLGLLLLPFAPLPFIGVFALMVSKLIPTFISAWKRNNIKNEILNIITIPNVVASLTIFPILSIYFTSNATASEVGGGWNDFYPIIYITFILFEFLLLALLLWPGCYKKPYFAFSIICLIVIPLIKYGAGQDFCMRVSIPFLFILMVYTIEFLVRNLHSIAKTSAQIRHSVIAILIVLLLGSITPLIEYHDSYVSIKDSNSRCTSLYADDIRTLNNGDIERNNFITKNSSETFFYKYLAKP